MEGKYNAWNGKYAKHDETNAKNAKENGGGSRGIR